jgi:hypothetical protein
MIGNGYATTQAFGARIEPEEPSKTLIGSRAGAGRLTTNPFKTCPTQGLGSSKISSRRYLMLTPC